MKTKHLLFGFAFVALSGLAINWSLFDAQHKQDAQISYHSRPNSAKLKAATAKQSQEKAPSIAGAEAWLAKIRANPKTGTISQQDIALARQSYEQILTRGENSGDMNWQFMGPDDVGGRTRAFLIDKKDNKTLWAGGVAGGLWKSTTDGLSWISVGSQQFNNLTISAIAQDDETKYIYVSTGENFAGLSYTNSTSTGFEGGGIFISTDNGMTFSVLPTTQTPNFKYVNEMIFDHVHNCILAGTNAGLYKSNDNGATWIKQYNTTANVTDIKVAENGTIIFSLVSSGVSRVFVAVEGSTSAVSKGAQFESQFNRIELAVAPSDANMMYALCSYYAGTQNKYFNLYKSIDGGSNWISVITQHSSSVDLFRANSQGYYDNIITVYPDDANKVIMGGIDLWTWSPTDGFEQISFWQEWAGTKYVHADQHNIVFHPDYATNKTIYFTNDGGIFKSKNAASTFTAMNKNYGVTQFYAIDCGPNGEILGGTQDNGSPFIDLLQPTDPQSSREILGGDGGYSAISELYPGAVFATIYFSELTRSNENGADATMQRNPFDIVGNKATYSNLNPGDESNPFVTPIAMWESFNNLESRIYIPYVVDTIIKILPSGAPDTIVEFNEGYTFIIPSTVVENKAFEYKISAQDITNNNGLPYSVGDTLPIREKFTNLLAIGGKNTIYFTREGLNFKNEYPNWDAVSGLSKLGSSIESIYINGNIGVQNVNFLKWSNDGKHLYAITNGIGGSRVFRFSGFESAYSYSGNTYDQIVTELDTIQNISSTNITSVTQTSSNPDVWTVNYNSGTSFIRTNVIQLDTVTTNVNLKLYKHDFLACDTTTVNNVLASSITRDSSYTTTYHVASLDAGSTHIDNVLNIDSTQVTQYVLDLHKTNLNTCGTTLISNVNSFSITSFNDFNFVLNFDSVSTTNIDYVGIIKIDTANITGSDTLLNLVRRTIVGINCTQDTVLNVNNDTIVNKISYTQNLPYWTLNTDGLTYDSIVRIDTISSTSKIMLDIAFKDLSGTCLLDTIFGVNADTVLNVDFDTISVNYRDITANANQYNKVIDIDTIASTYVIDIIARDTTYEMGEIGPEMVWQNRTINSTNRIVGTKIFESASSVFTGLDIDANNADNVMVSVGGYGTHGRVYYSTNATGTANFVSVNGSGLPAAPAYSCLISDTGDKFLLGTEYGVFSTSNMNGSSTVWTRESAMPTVPVFNLVQQHIPNGYIDGVGMTGVKNSGVIYAGTHGLGVWQMDLYKRPWNGVEELPTAQVDATYVKVYPNPVREIAYVEINAKANEQVKYNLYSLSGKLVYEYQTTYTNNGTQTHKINTSSLDKGVYVLSVTSGVERKVSKIIVE